MALAKGGLRFKGAKGRFWSKNENKKVQVLRMEIYVVEIFADLRRMLLGYLEAPNSILVEKKQMLKILSNLHNSPYFPRWVNGCLEPSSSHLQHVTPVACTITELSLGPNVGVTLQMPSNAYKAM